MYQIYQRIVLIICKCTEIFTFAISIPYSVRRFSCYNFIVAPSSIFRNLKIVDMKINFIYISDFYI